MVGNVKGKALKLHNFPLPETCLARCQNHIFVSLLNGTLADTNCVNLNKSADNNLNILPPNIKLFTNGGPAIEKFQR